MKTRSQKYILLVTAMLCACLTTGCGFQRELLDLSLIPDQDVSEATAATEAPAESTTAATLPPTEPPTEAPTTDVTLPPTEPPTEAPTTEAKLSIGIQIDPGMQSAADYRTAYKEIVQQHEAEAAEYHYDLIYVDEDIVPELVVDLQGYCVYLYTFGNGSVCTLMDGWVYGAFGNIGYSYVPGENYLYNYNHDFAGALGYRSYLKIDENHEIILDVCIEEYRFLDVNGDGYPEQSEYEAWVEAGEQTYYYLDGTEITEEEALAYDPYGDQWELVCAESTYDEIMAQLQ